MLEFLTEYPLGNRGSYRIDLLLIKKLSDPPIHKHIAKIFNAFNLFEIKGLGQSVFPMYAHSAHKEQDIYTNYLEQVTTANNQKKGDKTMVCEGLLNLFGTSSEEIRTRAKEEAKEEIKKEAAAFYQPTIDALSSKIDYLQNLLIQNNIPFNLES